MKKHSFFPSTIIEWNNLDLRFGKSFRFLKSTFLSSYNHLQTLYNFHNHGGICLFTRPGLSHLREHKYKNDFQDTINQLCSCGNDAESTEHFFSSTVSNLLMKDAVS